MLLSTYQKMLAVIIQTPCGISFTTGPDTTAFFLSCAAKFFRMFLVLCHRAGCNTSFSNMTVTFKHLAPQWRQKASKEHIRQKWGLEIKNEIFRANRTSVTINILVTASAPRVCSQQEVRKHSSDFHYPVRTHKHYQASKWSTDSSWGGAASNITWNEKWSICIKQWYNGINPNDITRHEEWSLKQFSTMWRWVWFYRWTHSPDSPVTSSRFWPTDPVHGWGVMAETTGN